MPEIQHATIVAAQPEKVTTALSTESGLRAFWTDQATARAEVGSEAVFGFGPNAETQFRMRVDAIEPGREVSWTCVDGPPEWVGTTVRWVAQSMPDGQLMVRFSHTGFPDDYDAAPVSFVWAMVLARLAEYASTGRPSPFFTRVGGM